MCDDVAVVVVSDLSLWQFNEEIALFENASPGELGLFDIVMDDDLGGLDDEGEDLSLLTKDFDVFDKQHVQNTLEI